MGVEIGGGRCVLLSRKEGVTRRRRGGGEGEGGGGGGGDFCSRFSLLLRSDGAEGWRVRGRDKGRSKRLRHQISVSRTSVKRGDMKGRGGERERRERRRFGCNENRSL